MKNRMKRRLHGVSLLIIYKLIALKSDCKYDTEFILSKPLK